MRIFIQDLYGNQFELNTKFDSPKDLMHSLGSLWIPVKQADNSPYQERWINLNTGIHLFTMRDHETT